MCLVCIGVHREFRSGQSDWQGPEVVKKSENPALDSKGDTSGKGVLSIPGNLECLAEIVSMKVHGANGQTRSEDHFGLNRIQFLRQEFRISRRIEERIRRWFPLHRKLEALEEIVNLFFIAREKRLHF